MEGEEGEGEEDRSKSVELGVYPPVLPRVWWPRPPPVVAAVGYVYVLFEVGLGLLGLAELDFDRPCKVRKGCSALGKVVGLAVRVVDRGEGSGIFGEVTSSS